MEEDNKIDRKELDDFSAKILINFALINTAALAASISIDQPFIIGIKVFSVGLMASVISQIFWYAESAFDYIYGDAKNPINEKIGIFTSFIILIFGYLSAGCILYGCLYLLTKSHWCSVLLSALIVSIPMFLLFYASIIEEKTRGNK